MDVGVIGEKAFGMRVVEVGAVVDGGLEGWSSAEDFGFPGVSNAGASQGGIFGR